MKGKKAFKNLMLENRRIYNVNREIVHLKSQSIETEKKNNKNSKNNKIINKMKNKSIVAMAISKGREIADAVEFKRYIGVASCKLVAINPTKAELDKLYNRTTEKEPNYLSETEVNGVKVPQAKIDFFFKLDDKYLDNDGNHIDTIFRKSVFVTNAHMKNRENTKIQVVDEYGNTAWVTNEQCANKDIPMYSNGPASISKNYRAIYRGEETVMNICKTFLGIPTTRVNANQQPTRYNNATKTWEVVADASDGLIRFDTIDEFFKGNFKEIQEIPAYQPKNRVKVLFGVKNVDGKEYQDIYDMVLRNSTTDYTYLSNDVNTKKSNGAYPNTEFKICDFQEYNPTPTNFSNPAQLANPFDSADDIF